MRAFVRKAITATATFSVALGIGFVMQYGDALAARLGVDDPVIDPAVPDTNPVAQVTTPQAATAVAEPRGGRAVPDGIVAAGMPLDMPTPRFDLVRFDAGMAGATTPSAPVPTASVAKVCAPSLSAEAQDQAMVRLTLDAECHPSAPVTIHHRGMMFSVLTDAKGQLQVDVPALSRDAMFVADLGADTDLATVVRVPDADTVARAVLQWQGEDGVQLHALEFGADYDDAGHVWAANVGTVSPAGQAGGRLTVLGDSRVSDARLAEVYTFPDGQIAVGDAVRLNVEVEITQRNCGRAVSAQSIRIAPGGDPVAVDLTMTMPDCDAVGEFIVLNNMFTDLTLAAQ
ncbi:hypothetical protein SAMN04488003_10947 [Loktanella fryxellensis]|uniref:Translocase n=1 Tax=Loktanella fryxellensis TaxID=245187 RepID=A0A1H8DRS6_9RHOB|nr:hypothetical protein [Loktanella fryxellensis]SEN10031.1 hypothetical protein SAMN04488003_10947 [Loktanella fryxellensis]